MFVMVLLHHSTIKCGWCPFVTHSNVNTGPKKVACVQVGKQDYSRPTDHTRFPIHTDRVNKLPQAHTRIPNLYDYFLNDVNEQIPEGRWKLTQEDATALLGAHGMMQNQNCMTDGSQPGTAPGMTDRTCSGAGGIQRQFKWSNHYWMVWACILLA